MNQCLLDRPMTRPDQDCMAAMSSVKQARPRKMVKGGTTSTRKHRFESFNQRIAKLEIDPIRRRRRNEVGESDLEESSSYFRASLDRWRDLNLSENFTAFTREVEPVCSSLPQLLHNNQRVFDTLVSYIEKRDALSLGPLLGLLSSFAHDLGVRFEDHFSKAVKLVASLAAKHGDVEVIEWSFTCLAWLFKYLSRLLVPNLRPVFEIMAPLLGREPQKLHTTRFAAEAMSFLVRKAATVYAKDRKPLDIIVDAICEDILKLAELGGQEAKVELYKYGLMTLLFDSIKGIDRKLFSGGPYIYHCMVNRLLASAESQRARLEEIVYGVTVALIHYTDSESFQPILNTVVEGTHVLDSNSNDLKIGTGGHLLFIISTVRKGTRVQDWAPMLDSILHLLKICTTSDNEAIEEVYKAAAVVLQSSPLQLMLPKFRTAMNTIANDRLAQKFLPFCNYFCDLGRERFQDLLMPYFAKFMVSKWQDEELELCMAIPRIVGLSARSKPVCPATWQEHMVRKFRDVINDDESIVQCNSYLELMEFTTISPESTTMILDALGAMVDRDLQTPSDISPRSLLTLGAGLKALLHQSPTRVVHYSDKWALFCSQAMKHGSYPPFLEAVLILVQVSDVSRYDIESMVDILVTNLHSSSHTLRLLSLRILHALYTKQKGGHADILATALAIENSSLDLQSARAISMQTRKMASQYEAASSDQSLQKAIPHFCFGMLTLKLSQAWNDATAALKQICETKKGEEIVSTLAFRWLEDPQPRLGDGEGSTSKQAQQGSLTSFQCSNLIHVERLIDQDVKEISAASEHLQSKFDATHTILQQKVVDAPALALRVLSAVPQVAEKRSRQFVPLFLSWATDTTEDEEPEASAEDTEISLMQIESLTARRLKRKDQKAMLDVFASFQNPKVLYRTSDVFAALQGLLSNGNVDIQTSALRALFTWKVEGIRPYQENLLNLLDDARFRDEISTFLQVDDHNSTIQEDHRAALMPVILRLLYGKMIAGTGSGSKSQAVKRKAVLQTLCRLDESYLRDFTQIALGRLSDVELIKDGQLNGEVLAKELISVRKQLGLVNMMKDLLDTLGDRLAPFTQNLATALLHCLIRAARSLASPDQNVEQVQEEGHQVSLYKAVRQRGLQCLNLLFQYCPAELLQPYVPSLFSEVLSPRLESLPVETAQAVSGILQLFSTWASSRTTVMFLVKSDARALSSVINCLEVPSAKDGVKLFVFENILERIVQLSKPSSAEGSDAEDASQHIMIAQTVLQPNIDKILNGAGNLLRKSPSKELLGATIQTVSALAPLVEASSHAMNLLKICTFLLDQPSHRVSPRTKGELLQIVQHFVPLVDSKLPLDLQDRIYRTISSLFGYFKDRANRVTLSQVMSVLAQRDAELQDVAQLCTSLNSFSARKMDEPDFDERLRAFSTINEAGFKDFTAKQWRPILYNVLFYVKDSEELAIRTNASFTLRRLVETNVADSENAKSETFQLIKSVLLPALRVGVSESSELVRIEYLSIMAHLIRYNPHWEEVSDMAVLLVVEDEEASFFGNILHIQQHRRMRALRRLAAEAKQGGLRSTNVAHFFLPLIEHFVFDKAEDESAHNLSAETVVTAGALVFSLEWPQYRAMFRRFSGYIQSKPDVQKTVIKLLGVVIDALSEAAEHKESASHIVEQGLDVADQPASSSARSRLATTMPRHEKLTADLTDNLLPSLEKYLHDKDESTVSLRVPVAVSVVKLLNILPIERLKDRLPPVLTDVCHILRSRAQESRDLTRKTLVEISTLIGPAYFGFVLKELRSSLARGYQLHVLSYTVHSILVATSSIFKPGDLDYCLPQIVAIIMDDIFGATGQEKDAEEYISKMKEVKSSKSYDSIELVAKTATVDHFVQLIKPLQALLEDKMDLRMVKKIDELLRRIGIGLVRNEAVQNQRVLVFCYEIMQEVYKTGQTSANERSKKEDYRTKRLLSNHKGADKAGSRKSTSTYDYKLTRFALDMLRAVLQKYDGLQTPANLSGFIPIIGDAIVQSNEEVQASALRLLTIIVKVPLKTIDNNAAIYVAECVKTVKASTSTNVEVAQAALKFVSAILRERTNVHIQESKESHEKEGIQKKDLAYLLKRILPDLEELDKQGVAFNFLRAVLTRKVDIPEVYEVIDAVRVIMKTNHTRGARDMARGAYIQFFMEYPQSKKLFSQQMEYLVTGLEYPHAEGRQSIFETIHLLISKIGEDLVQDILATFFFPLVMRIVNDESSQCREIAGALLNRLFERADAERTLSFLGVIRGWLDRSEELLVRVALQIYGMYLDVHGAEGEKEIPVLQSHVAQILKSNLKAPLDADWELLYFALQTFAKTCQLFPTRAFDTKSASIWSSVRQCLSFPHAWVKTSSAKLLGTYFADFARTNASSEDATVPFKGSGGLLLSEQEIIEVTRSSLGLLRVPGVSGDLASQSVRNLVFSGKIMAQTSMAWPQLKDQQSEIEYGEEKESEDEVEVDENFPVKITTKPALGHLICQTSLILRRGPQNERGTFTLRSPSLIPLQASLQLLGALSNAVPLPTLTPHIATILLPLHNLTDAAIAAPSSTDPRFGEGYKTLVGNAQELMALLQKKMGTTGYISVLSKVREEVKARREGRRVKRRIEAVADPQRAGKAKKRKGEKKREKRKEKSGEQRGLRRGW